MNQTVPNKEQTQYYQPHYQVVKEDAGYRVDVTLPGVSQSAASIVLDKNTLTVEATPAAHWQDSWQPVQREIPSGRYRLVLDLNVKIDEDRVKATAKDGILSIYLPLAEESKPQAIAIE